MKKEIKGNEEGENEVVVRSWSIVNKKNEKKFQEAEKKNENDTMRWHKKIKSRKGEEQNDNYKKRREEESQQAKHGQTARQTDNDWVTACMYFFTYSSLIS